MKQNLLFIAFIIIIIIIVFSSNIETFRRGRRGRHHRGRYGRRHRGHYGRRHRGRRRWYNIFYDWSPWYFFSGLCKNGCTNVGYGNWGCQYPGSGPNDCMFASDCAGCGINRPWYY